MEGLSITIELPPELQGTVVQMHEMISDVRREIALRHAVYPKFIASGKMKLAAAQLEVHRMEAVLRFLEFCHNGGVP